ncbi:hypothetical protein F5Y18DRAFT_412230 [Xylariaceae sp. FL1019]|nr:hypothetical protein F5Y18DRAFT_412230 [Xylariaceae sp. FL1019]
MTEAQPSTGHSPTSTSSQGSLDTSLPSKDSAIEAPGDKPSVGSSSSGGVNKPRGEPVGHGGPAGEQSEEESADDRDEDEVEDGEDDDDDEEEDEEEEPRLKYARLTQHLGPVYRNGDSTSAFLVAGDKMIMGTHKGNVHVIQLPTFQPLIAYHAHDASITSISISPHPPPALPPTLKPDAVAKAMAQSISRPSSIHSESSPARQQRKPRELPQVPNLPSNNIYITTSSMDGLVRVQSLVDLKDCQLRNFARPIQAAAVSPNYKTDRTYLSGGRAGNLILTVGAPQGRSTSTTIGTAAAAASGWLGSMGLGTNTGKDTVIHSGEGAISTIKWSLSGKYVVWLNEHGIKIMRTNLHLESGDAEDAWKRIGHIDRPHTDEWEEMAGYWDGRAEWIDDQAMSQDDVAKEGSLSTTLSPAASKLVTQVQSYDKKIERLLVGWGGTIWIINIHPADPGSDKTGSQKSIGRAEIAKILRMDCIISGISLYTQDLLLVLAYCTPQAENDGDGVENNGSGPGTSAPGHRPKTSASSSSSGPSGGIRHRQNAIRPELRLIDLVSQAEIDKDSLPVSNFQGLSSNDYHLGVLPASRAASVAASRGALEALAGFGNEMWNAAINPMSLFNSGASVRSKDSTDGTSGSRVGGTKHSARLGTNLTSQTVHPNLVKPGAKLFIHSPYDCILATKRDLGDHLAWLLEHDKYEDAWSLLDEHPEALPSTFEKSSLAFSATTDPGSSAANDLFEDNSSIMEPQNMSNAPIEKEKQRIGELWVQDLLDHGDWGKAAQTIAKVVHTPDRWEKWVYTFAGATRFDEIVNYIPSERMHPPIPGTIYEIVLGHYLRTDKPHFKELLDRWDPDLFDVQEISTALDNLLKFRDVRDDSIDDGEKGRDWRIVMESLARLHEANGKFRDALKCHIGLRDADSAMRLIKDNHLADAVTDDIASFIALRVDESRLSRMGMEELTEATSEAITLLVDETHRGLIRVETVVSQLEKKDLNLYLFFYFRGLWRGYRERPVDESVSLVDEFADLAVHIFALYDSQLLMDFLKVSTSYTFDKAVQECENGKFIPELVYLYSKTGQMKRALYLIIDRLGDVSQAIAFVKEQDDPDLWEDLLEYSMDKPRFIRGLLEEVGTSINPITLVRRIPEGLEIPGLREGLKHIMKEHEIQYSISSGVARVLRSEVAAAQTQLRGGQRKGVKFDIVVHSGDHVDIEAKDVPNPPVVELSSPTATPHTNGSGTPSTTPAKPDSSAGVKDKQQSEHDHREAEPGHCAKCHEPFSEFDTETLVGFACGHVFHVTHLLEVLGQDVDSNIVGDGEIDRSRGGRYVGSKVTQARLLRDRVRSGCPVCRYKVEVVQGGGM